jgi:Rad3-related DNA helicase
MNFLKIVSFFISVIFLSSISNLVLGQELSRAERTELVSEIKGFKRNPEKLKEIKQESTTLDAQLATAKETTVRKKADLNELNRELGKKDEAIESLQERLRRLRGEMGEVNAARQGRGGSDCEFSVQIGAYENRDLTKYMDNNPNFLVEQSDGLKKYILGYFTSYWEAKSFSKHLDKSGAQTYVVGYYKGARIPDLKDMTQCTF